jgi:hypothetical protein
MSVLQRLRTNGFAVVSVTDAAVAETMRKRVVNDLLLDPVFVDPSAAMVTGMSMGGFGGLATPWSTFNPAVRDVRKVVHARVLEVFDDYFAESPLNKLEQLMDRPLVRTPEQRVSGESVHRDESPGTLDGDQILGGWFNLDPFDHTFSCCPGSHSDAGGTGGFVRLPDPELYKSRLTAISIPPGHMIMFYENIVHEVRRGKKMKVNMHRVFTGWRLTQRDAMLDKELFNCLDIFKVPRLKSGQEVPMYAHMHLACWIDKIVMFSQNIHDKYCYDHTVKSGVNAGGTYRIVHRFVPNLEDTSNSMWVPYTDEEKQMFVPSRPAAAVAAAAVNFNSKSKEYWELSNFYGGVEFEYQKHKFWGANVHRLLDDMNGCSTEKFNYYYEKLTGRTTGVYWSRNGVPIYGILAKLVGGAATNSKRYDRVCQLIGGSFEIRPNTSDREKRILMTTLVGKKFQTPRYRDVLLSTGNAELHEIGRGRNNWIVSGEDWMGILLTEVRAHVVLTRDFSRHFRGRDYIDLDRLYKTVGWKSLKKFVAHDKAFNGNWTVLKATKKKIAALLC